MAGAQAGNPIRALPFARALLRQSAQAALGLSPSPGQGPGSGASPPSPFVSNWDWMQGAREADVGGALALPPTPTLRRPQFQQVAAGE
jgi:hypothetical protein